MTISDLPPETTIYVAVKAVDAAGNQSGISNVLAVTTKEGTARGSSSSGSSNNQRKIGELTPPNAGKVRMVIKAPDGYTSLTNN